MKLMKIAAYVLLGYVVFELYRGMRGGGRSVARVGRERFGSRTLGRALNEGAGRMNVTGPARGKAVETEEPTGAHMRHTVGRGVVPA